MIPRTLALAAVALAALAMPVALAFEVDVDVGRLPVPVPAHLQADASVPLLSGSAAVAPVRTADQMVTLVEASPQPQQDAQPQQDPSSSGSGPSQAPADFVPVRALGGVPVPLTTVGAIPVLRDLGPAIPLGIGPVLPGAPAGAAAPAPSAAPIAPQADAAVPVASARPAAVAASLAAVAAVSAAAPAFPLGWDRLKRFLLPLALYTRIAKERLLDHGSREKLLVAVRERPGLPVTDLADAAGVPRNTATYHLRRLEREGLVLSQRSGRVRVWFVPGGARREEAPAFAALRHDTTRGIARMVATEPGVDQQALCERLGLGASLVHWHVDRLVQSGLVRKERDGRRVRYYPAEGMPRMAAALSA